MSFAFISHQELLSLPISANFRECVTRLQAYKSETVDLSIRPKKRLAAVLVLLYEKEGVIRVLLTTRSMSLRAHPGQTALPGGKVDESDADLLEAAHREAFEEVALPFRSPHVHTVCTLRPFLSSSKLLVTPVVAVLDDPSVLDHLQRSPREVDRIFTHPLEAILDPSQLLEEELAPKGSEDWSYDPDLYCSSDIELPWLGNSDYRMHRFRSSASAIKGLTAEILIMTATIAYGRPPTYDRYAPRQFVMFNDVMKILDQQYPISTKETTGTSTPAEVGVPVTTASS